MLVFSLVSCGAVSKSDHENDVSSSETSSENLDDNSSGTVFEESMGESSGAEESSNILNDGSSKVQTEPSTDSSKQESSNVSNEESKKSEDKASSNSSGNSSSSSANSSEIRFDGAQFVKELRVSQYVQSVTSKDIWNQVKYEASQQGMELSLDSRSGSVVYKYRYYEEVVDNAVEILNKNLEDTKEILKATADTIRKEEPSVDNVIWEYYDMNGVLLASITL